jgi:hypothetical protein
VFEGECLLMSAAAHFRLIVMPCCGQLLCWVNPRLPNYLVRVLSRTLMPQLGMRDKERSLRDRSSQWAYRGSFVRRFNCTVASTASMRSPPAAMA